MAHRRKTSLLATRIPLESSFTRTRCAPLSSCAAANANDLTVNASAAFSVFPVLRPVLLDGATGLANILEIGTAKVFVLLDVEPEVENVLCAFTLQEQAGRRGCR